VESNTPDRRFLCSIDFGDVAGNALEALTKQQKISKSEVARRCVLLAYNSDILSKWKRLSSKILAEPKPKRGPAKQTDEERHVIATYRRVYNYQGRLHHAAVLACIRSLVKSGITESEVASIVEVSKNDVWLANRLARGEHVPLNEILSDKMVLRILPLLENTEQAELENAHVLLEGTVKPKAFAYLRATLPPEMLSAAWDDIQAATSNSDVETLIEQYARKVPSDD